MYNNSYFIYFNKLIILLIIFAHIKNILSNPSPKLLESGNHFSLMSLAENKQMMEAFLKKEINHKNKNNENNQCTEDWTTFRNPKDGHLYGYRVFVEDMINYFQVCKNFRGV